MRLTDRLSQPQRIVVVIALGAAFVATGIYLGNIGNTTINGWYAYAPLTKGIYPPPTGLAGWLRLLIWLALIIVWAVASIRVLRPAREVPGGPARDFPGR